MQVIVVLTLPPGTHFFSKFYALDVKMCHWEL